MYYGNRVIHYINVLVVFCVYFLKKTVLSGLVVLYYPKICAVKVVNIQCMYRFF